MVGKGAGGEQDAPGGGGGGVGVGVRVWVGQGLMISGYYWKDDYTHSNLVTLYIYVPASQTEVHYVVGIIRERKK